MQEEPKQQFLKREEVKTMNKDIAQLREEEAIEERKRIAELKTAQEPAEKKEIQAPPGQHKTEEGSETEKKVEAPQGLPSQAMPPSPFARPDGRRPLFEELEETEGRVWPKKTFSARPSFFDKIFIRIGVVLILVLVFTNMFLFWHWYIRDGKNIMLTSLPKRPPKEIPNQEAPPEETAPKEQAPQELIIPAPLIIVEATTTLEIASSTELFLSLEQTLRKQAPAGQFTRLLIKNTAENKFLGLREFSEEFSANIPPALYQKLENDFTLFIYNQTEGNRPGYIGKVIEKEGLSESLLSWERTMEQDTEKLFSLLGKNAPAMVPYFRQTAYKGAVIRYQTFSKLDLGICYGTINDYFVFTTSWQSLLKAVDKIVENRGQ